MRSLSHWPGQCWQCAFSSLFAAYRGSLFFVGAPSLVFAPTKNFSGQSVYRGSPFFFRAPQPRIKYGLSLLTLLHGYAWDARWQPDVGTYFTSFTAHFVIVRPLDVRVLTGTR